MLTTNRSYKGLTFNCSDISLYDTLGYVFLLTEENHDTTLRTDIFDRASFHGGYSSETLASGRIFSFTGKILSKTPLARETAMRFLISKIQPEGNPNVQGRGFYDLERDDDAGLRRYVKAKVYTAPQITKDLQKQEISFTFELLSENETIFSLANQSITGGVGLAGGFTLPTPIPTYLSGYTNFITLTNNGNRQTPVRIRVQGSVQSPKIINLTNQYNYKINGSTTDLIIDNRNESNSPRERLLVTDSGVSITEKRSQGGGIYLQPGINHLIVLASNYPNTAIVTVDFRDGWIR